MTTALTGAVELLDRSLGYTRVILAGVTDADLGRPTPCAAWTLGDLLAHMEDALDAFTEAAGGTVRAATPGTGGGGAGDERAGRVARLQRKACSLLGAWSGEPRAPVGVAGHELAGGLLVAAAALEITVHGWDVGRSLGTGPPVPDHLAGRLLPVAHLLVQPADRVVRFAPPVRVGREGSPGDRLLAFLGRG